jgi:hypothetical protein
VTRILVYAIGGLALVGAVLTGAARPTDLILPAILATSLATGLLVALVLRRRSMLGLVDTVRSAEAVVPSGILDAPDGDLADLIAEIRGHGFALVGGTDTSLRGGQPVRTWVMTEPAGTTWVEIGRAGGPLAVFLSQAGDGRFLETRAAEGEVIDHPDLLARAVPGDPADALAAHRTLLAEWIERHGRARAVRTLDDFLAVEPVVRDRTGGLRILSYVEHVVNPSIRSWAIAAGIGLVTTVVLLARLGAERG